MNDNKKQQNNTHSTETRVVDREYYAHPETARNKWFNYSDPYYLENEQVKEYQENLEKNEQKIQSEQNEKILNNSNNATEQMGSTTDYTQYAQQNQYSQGGINPFENTTPPEPIVDLESHINLNTAPSYAGDHLYPHGYIRTEKASNSYTPQESFDASHTNDENDNNQKDKNDKFYEQQTKKESYENHNHEGAIK